jgi:ribose transport system permease protein
MLKKDLGLFLLILVVGAVVAFLNPRFISPINLENTANLVGLFGLFSIGEGFVIITGGIDLSIGSQFALFGVVFVDLLVNYHLPWILAVLIIIGFGVILGWVHGFLITRMNLQPFVVTLCGLLIYRGVARWYTDDGTAGFEFGQSFPALEWITTGRTYGIPHTFCIARCLGATCSPSARMKRRRVSPALRLKRSSSPPTSSAARSPAFHQFS